jgi:hypothetical protein
MQFIKIIFLCLILTNMAFAKKLPELQTKQALDNIRLISNDGKFTYYQQRSGDLQMSTNYANKVIMKGEMGTYYLLRSTSTRKKIIAEVIKNYHKRLDFFALNEVYLIDFGKTKATKIAAGNEARLHLEDRWISYFHPRSKTIFLENLTSKSKPFKIKLNNKVNPYYIPQVIMPTPDTVLYTDINNQGYMAIQMYTLSEKKIQTIYKSKFAGMRLDFCVLEENLYMGEFSYDGVNLGSSIVKIPLYENKNFKNISTLYQSELPDIGHLTCKEDTLYFIKAIKYDEKINLRTTEAVKLSLDSNKVEVVTSLNYVTNIVNMDGMILIPYRDKYYVAQGKSVLNQDALNENTGSEN